MITSYGFAQKDLLALTSSFLAAITAAGATVTDTMENALDRLVRDLRGVYNPAYATTDILSKFIFIYPMMGGIAAAHSINLVNTATYGITWVGSPTHDANGVNFNGTTQQGDTGFLPSSIPALFNNGHMSYYTRTLTEDANTGGMGTMGGLISSNSNWGIAINRAKSYYHDCNADATIASVNTGTNLRGLLVGSRTSATDNKLYMNASQIASSTVDNSSYSLPGEQIHLGAFYPITARSNKQCAFASIGYSMTSTEVTNFYNAVQAFQTALSRQV